MTSWYIELNRAKTISSTIVAHEFGHIIGLKDMSTTKNKNTLMYGYDDRTVLGPSNSDRLGALVITGQHTAHTWGYMYYGTNSGTNSHLKYCTVCKGRTNTVSNCTYKHNICIYCGTSQGASPNSIVYEIE